MTKKGMPHVYWGEVVSMNVYIMNKDPTIAIHDVMLEERFIGIKPDLSHLKVFGCVAMYTYLMSCIPSWI